MKDKMYSIEHSVSIIPEKGFQLLYDLSDTLRELLQTASEISLMLRAISGVTGD